VLTKHPSSGRSFAFARLRYHRLLATGLVNERIIANALTWNQIVTSRRASGVSTCPRLLLISGRIGVSQDQSVRRLGWPDLKPSRVAGRVLLGNLFL
jgi:hypothetical protein